MPFPRRRRLCIYACVPLIGQARRLALPIDTQLELFDTMVAPILLYAGEVWGGGNLNILEKLHLKFCKILLQVKPSTPTCMVYGELGRYPLSLTCKTKIISYWANVLRADENKYSSVMYKLMYGLHIAEQCTLPWISSVKQILDDCGLSNIWTEQDFPCVSWLVKRVELSLQDQFRQTWSATVHASSKCILYKHFKLNLELEKYLLDVPAIYRKYICKLRTTNHKLAVERGRYVNIPRHLRFCEMCGEDVMGDEFHFLLQCSRLSDVRKQFLPRYYTKHVNMPKFIQLMKCENIALTVKVGKFIKAGFAFQ